MTEYSQQNWNSIAAMAGRTEVRPDGFAADNPAVNMEQPHLDLEILPVQEADIAALVEMFLLVERQHERYWPLRWALRTDVQDRYTRWITSNRSHPDWLFVVARHKSDRAEDTFSDEVIGGLAAAINQEIPIYQFTHYAFIHDLAVRADVRRHGVGRALIEYARKWAGEKGVNQLRLMAAESNDPAKALFDKCGFRTTYNEMVLPINPP